ncbi:MAG: hypothetical protein COA70_06190 [Planctomycetota bacterium]|nr:MAG: hypothetical protein COA70_06190 [Planctomycetota bacterium]
MRLLLLILTTPFLLQDPTPRPGYDDTPRLPGQEWRVHDLKRPYPIVVKPGKNVGDAPSDALILFDGTNLDAWMTPDGEAPTWKLVDGAMVVAGNAEVQTKASFGDSQLHVEWASPADRSGDSQGMGNSGVFLMGLYEIQVLDTWNNTSYADGTAGAIYGQFPPSANVCRPSGEWQTYDILFTAPKFSESGDLDSPATVTLLHNGVLVHHNRELLGPTVHRTLPPGGAHAEKLPVKLQNHGDPVRYRNLWIRSLD